MKRLLSVLAEPRLAGVTACYGWSEEAQARERQLQHLLESTALREVPDERPGAFHLRAAELARHPCYGLARRWYLHLEELNTQDPEQLARLLSEGALVPLLAVLMRDDGARVRLFYNQSALGAGPVEEGSRHYLDHRGRMRPDLTLTVTAPGVTERAVVMEIKHSTNHDTLLAGYQKAQLYRFEYARWLTGWPRAILIASGPMERGAPSR